MDNVLSAKQVIVIGGTTGIGLEVARQSAERGAHVTVASSTQERVDAALKLLPDGTDGVRLDVTDENAVRGLFTREFDHLVYTAGDSMLIKPVTEVPVADARRYFDVRYWGALAAVKYAAPLIRPGGSIVLTSGIAAVRPAPGWALTTSITAAAEGLVRALAVELAPAIRVNAVRPGPVRTGLWDGVAPDRDALLNEFAAHLPAGRVGEPGEVAAAYVHLMASGFSTGSVITIDGGYVLA
jgi:NAD(P)-dependent dehydrogenase (short-subunit alcohol dehydrogenase family)